MVCQPTLVGMPANGGWYACQRWLACLPAVVGAPANGGWRACQRRLASQVTSRSIYSPRSSHRKSSCFHPKGTTSHLVAKTKFIYDLHHYSPATRLFVSTYRIACYTPRKQLHEQTRTTDTYRQTRWLSKTPNTPWPALALVNPTGTTASGT